MGINKRELDQVPASAASLDEAARLGNMPGDLRTRIDAACKLAEFTVDKIDHLMVQLHRVDPRCAVIERPQHVSAATGAEHQRLRPVDQMKRQSHRLLVEIAERLEIACEARHGG